jgi:hypothetical protein
VFRRTFVRQSATSAFTVATLGTVAGEYAPGEYVSGEGTTVGTGSGRSRVVRSIPGQETVDLGAEGLSEGDLIDPYFSDHFQNGVEVRVPGGTYRWRGGGIDATSNAALVGDGAVFLEVAETSNFSHEVFAEEGTVLIKDMTQVGTVGANDGAITARASPNARVVFDNFNRPDGATSGGTTVGHFVPTRHRGAVYYLNCTVAEFPNNGLYASAAQKDGQGRVVIEGGLYANNNVASIRIGSSDSVVRGASILYDEEFADIVDPGGDQLGRGVWVRFGGRNITIADCDITHEQGAPGAVLPLGIFPRDERGDGTVRNVRIKNELDVTPIRIHESVQGNWSGSGVHLTGGGDLRVSDPVDSWVACRSSSGGDCQLPTLQKRYEGSAIRAVQERSRITAAPGTTVRNVLRIVVGDDRPLLSVDADIAPRVTASSFGDVTVNGDGGDVEEGPADGDSISALFQDLTAGSVVVLPYELSIPGDQPRGTTIRLDGLIESGIRRLPIPVVEIGLVGGFHVGRSLDGPSSIRSRASFEVGAIIGNVSDSARTERVEYRLDTGGDGPGDDDVVATRSISLDGLSTRSVTFEVPGSATADLDGTYEHGIFSEGDSTTDTISVEGSGSADVERFDGVGGEPDGEIQFGEVRNAIRAYNQGERIAGEEVAFDDITQLIAAFND